MKWPSVGTTRRRRSAAWWRRSCAGRPASARRSSASSVDSAAGRAGGMGATGRRDSSWRIIPEEDPGAANSPAIGGSTRACAARSIHPMFLSPHTSLTDALSGAVVLPYDERSDQARSAFNLLADQQPSAVAFPVDERDVAAAVEYA